MPFVDLFVPEVKSLEKRAKQYIVDLNVMYPTLLLELYSVACNASKLLFVDLKYLESCT